MKTLAFVCVALLGVLCVVSCSNEGTPANPSQDIALDQIVSNSPPAASGPYVIRYDTSYWVWFADEESGMMAIIGLDVWDICTGQGQIDMVSVMDVTEPNAQDAINQIVHGENMHVSVWPIVPVNCASLLSTDPLATGYVDMTATDNDYYAWLHEDPKRMNAYGWSANGFVETPDNQNGVVSVIARFAWRNFDGSYLSRSKVNLTLLDGAGQ